MGRGFLISEVPLYRIEAWWPGWVTSAYDAEHPPS